MDRATITIPGIDQPVAPLGVGTWAWGDKSTWGMGGYDDSLTEETIAGAFDASLDGGLALFDTAEVYGSGESERIIGRLLRRDPSLRSKVVLATKFMPMPHKLNVGSAMRAAIEKSIDRLGIDHVDLYQIHGPISLRSKSALADALASVHDAGLTKAVGVSNYSIKEMRTIHRELSSRNVPLASNQIEYSLLRRSPETGGLVSAAEQLGVVILAYSPIGQGRLTGKYSADNPPPGRRGFSAHPMEKVDRVLDVVRGIGDTHGRTPAQVSLRWLIEKGTVPIPGAKNADQATQNAGALGWSLTADEIAELDRVALEDKTNLFNRFWQHG